MTTSSPDQHPDYVDHLNVEQDTIPKAAPGQPAKFNVKLSARPPGYPIDTGTIRQTFNAPTGFVFTGEPTYAYYESSAPEGYNFADYDISEDGTTLTINSELHINTDPDGSDARSVVYTFPVEALSDAEPGDYHDGQAVIGEHDPMKVLQDASPGTYEDGTATIGDHAPVKLSGTVEA